MSLVDQIHRDDGCYFDCAFLARVPERLVEAATARRPRSWKDIVDGARRCILV